MKKEKSKNNLIDIENIIERISNNDPLAFKVFYNNFYSQLYSYVCYFTNDETLIKEILSDIFISIWQSRKKLKEVKNMDSYLFILTKNHTFRHIKNKNQYRTISIADIPESELIEKIQPENLIIQEELKQTIEIAINSLPNRCKLIFTLIKGEKKTYKEVAELLSISEKTVHAQMCIAVKKLGSIIKTFL